eukprot:2298406-Amphidinium_carterae.1
MPQMSLHSHVLSPLVRCGQCSSAVDAGKGQCERTLAQMILRRAVKADLEASSFNFYVWIP